MAVADRFRAFFAAANAGAEPYPWQCALVERVAATGRWPDIAAPTGSGKSSVVDAHVFLVADHASGGQIARPPRRLILVAPRRVLVDDQFERAQALADLLREAPDGSALAHMSRALRSLCTADTDSPASPIGVWRLRGGVRLENGWRLEPAACQIICATPEMWGSRLLMRGYGASRASRNLESGLLGFDAVAVIDEAHLHARLLATGRRIAAGAQGGARLQVVGMSATGRLVEDQIELSEADHADAALARRVRAVKRVELREVDDLRKHGQAEIVETARRLACAGTVGVFVNDVSTAVSVAAMLRAGGATVELVCGRLRIADLDRLRSRRPGLLTPLGDRNVDFLVSTQSLEVGVDLDLPAMVTMLASPSALAQRAGRLNRTGSRAESTFAVVTQRSLAALDPAGEQDRRAVPNSGPYDSGDLIRGARWLAALDGSISPESVGRVGLPDTPRPPLPALRQVDLETLELTSSAQSADPEPELYIQDPSIQSDELAIAARNHLDCEREVVEQMLLACPPRAHEIATLSLANVKELQWILGQAGGGAWVLRYENADLRATPVDESLPLRAGDTLVVPDGAPICAAGVVGRPASGQGEPLDDVLAEAPPGTGLDEIVLLERADIEAVLTSDPDLGSRAARVALADALESSSHARLADRLRRHRRLSELHLHWCGGADADQGLLVVLDMSKSAALMTISEPAQLVTLDSHHLAVQARMERVLAALRLDLAEVEAPALLVAARHHDDGKQHPYFQARMGRGPDDEPLAKPRSGHRPDRGDGWRHEQLSAAYAAAVTDGDPLVVTLVASHHGHGRALFDRDARDLVRGWEGCPPEVAATAIDLFGSCGRYELLRARVRDRLGVHRLAWLEALLRCADMQVSREGA